MVASGLLQQKSGHITNVIQSRSCLLIWANFIFQKWLLYSALQMLLDIPGPEIWETIYPPFTSGST